MRVKLDELKTVVDKMTTEKRLVESLREEIANNFDQSVVTDVDIRSLAKNVNEHLDFLQHTGRNIDRRIKPSLLARFAEHKSPDVRKMIARLLPERYIVNMRYDVDPYVRYAVARRLPLNLVKEMRRHYPDDDELHVIFEEKKRLDNELHLYDDERMGETARPENSQAGLSDTWYDEKAHKLIQDYGNNIEGRWEELAVRRFCASTKAASGIDIDAKKLLDHVMKRLKDKDDRTLERYSLKEVASHLREGSELVLPYKSSDYDESDDDVNDASMFDMSPRNFVEYVNENFAVEQRYVSSALHAHCLAEGMEKRVSVPYMAQLRSSMTIKDEVLMDAYVANWNKLQVANGVPLSIKWVNDPNDDTVVLFRAGAR